MFAFLGAGFIPVCRPGVVPVDCPCRSKGRQIRHRKKQDFRPKFHILRESDGAGWRDHEPEVVISNLWESGGRGHKYERIDDAQTIRSFCLCVLPFHQQCGGTGAAAFAPGSDGGNKCRSDVLRGQLERVGNFNIVPRPGGDRSDIQVDRHRLQQCERRKRADTGCHGTLAGNDVLLPGQGKQCRRDERCLERNHRNDGRGDSACARGIPGYERQTDVVHCKLGHISRSDIVPARRVNGYGLQCNRTGLW